MIFPSKHFNLGQDRTRIKDPADGERQEATVRAILSRFFDRRAAHRWEVQVLADEVGMGKTFVALGCAYEILAHLRSTEPEDRENDLRRCYQKVLIITPQNNALFNKWSREVREFVRRCVTPRHQPHAKAFFAPTRVDRLDELAREIGKRGTGPRVVVTHMGVLGGGKFRHYDLKRRFLLGALFRYWGTRFRNDARERLLRGAPAGWPRPSELTALRPDELDLLPFSSEEEALHLLNALARSIGDAESCPIEELLAVCQEIAAPYARDRCRQFGKVESKLTRLYRKLSFASLKQSLPLVIVDEAHNWKNGPSRHANGFQRFATLIAPRTRRALLLTATPFQLRPDEMLEVLKAGDHLEPCATHKASQTRREHLAAHRESVVRGVLERSAKQSRRFAKAWGRLPAGAGAMLAGAWSSHQLTAARGQLEAHARERGVLDERLAGPIVDGALAGLDPNIRELLREALWLYAYNVDLSQELGVFVIRHRRKTDHRLFRVGAEYAASLDRALARPDRHMLHPAPGLDVKGAGELPHYLLMRCVSEMKSLERKGGRSSLGTALTGCYSTLLESSEGARLQRCFAASSTGRAYLDLLLRLVGEDKDAEHPKVRELIEGVTRSWHAGEKTLIFCFRTHTARRLRALLNQQIETELEGLGRRVLGGAQALRTLRARFTGRDRDLVVLGLDRILWSLYFAARTGEIGGVGFDPAELALQEGDLRALATLAIRARVDLTGERLDRVFLHRAVEHIISRRLSSKQSRDRFASEAIDAIQDESWVSFPYGVDVHSDDVSDGAPSDSQHPDEADEGTDRVEYDERGVHASYRLRTGLPLSSDIDRLEGHLRERLRRARRQDSSVLDSYTDGPSFWFSASPKRVFDKGVGAPTARSVAFLHRQLVELTTHEGSLDWTSRRLVFQALRRTLLRESVLLRLLPPRTGRDQSGFGEVLVDSFFADLPGQRESMADRMGVFLEDLRAASGRVQEPETQRGTSYQATLAKDRSFVALVDGSTANETRERLFAGFNTPLWPEVLVCTSVGQEGIDLHRHCRHVVHYDLAWNPAVLEQRTGRVDRIGSKTFRERAGNGSATDFPSPSTASGGGGTDAADAARRPDAFLDVGVPFLAGTYDERMYEELRLRAQTFEVLTGGDVGADNLEGRDDVRSAEGKAERLELPSLPAQMMSDLPVRLHVWSKG